MNQEQTKYHRRNLTTQSAFDNNTAVWSGNPKFVSTKNQFDTLIDEASALDQEASQSTTGGTRSKDQVREALNQKLLVLAGTLYAHGVLENDAVLQDMLVITISPLAKMQETEVVTYAETLHEKATELLAVLTEEYGFTEAELTDLNTTIDEYRPLIGTPRQRQASINAAKKSLGDIVKAANNLLDDVLDKLMLRYRYTSPQFYAEYEQARTIVD